MIIDLDVIVVITVGVLHSSEGDPVQGIDPRRTRTGYRSGATRTGYLTELYLAPRATRTGYWERGFP